MILQELAAHGIQMSRPSIYGYIVDGLCPEAAIPATHRGRGTRTLYSWRMPAEVAASWMMVQQFAGHKDAVRRGRLIALRIEREHHGTEAALRADPELLALLRTDVFAAVIAQKWLAAVLDFRHGPNDDDLRPHLVIAQERPAPAHVTPASMAALIGEAQWRSFVRSSGGGGLWRVLQRLAYEAKLQELGRDPESQPTSWWEGEETASA